MGGFDDISGNNQLFFFDSTSYALLGSNIATSFNNYDEITIASVSSDGQTFAAISANSISPIQMEIYDISTMQIVRTFNDNFGVMKWVLFSPHSDATLYTTSNDQTVKFYRKSPVDSSYELALSFYTDDFGYPNCLNAAIPGILIFSADKTLVFLNISCPYP